MELHYVERRESLHIFQSLEQFLKFCPETPASLILASFCDIEKLTLFQTTLFSVGTFKIETFSNLTRHCVEMCQFANIAMKRVEVLGTDLFSTPGNALPFHPPAMGNFYRANLTRFTSLPKGNTGGSRLIFSVPLYYISFSSSTFPGAPYQIFLRFLLWLPCHFYLVFIKQ